MTDVLGLVTGPKKFAGRLIAIGIADRSNASLHGDGETTIPGAR